MKLLVTDTFRRAHATRLAELASLVEPVELVGDVVEAEFDLAFFSPDCYPDRSAAFMSAVLAAPKLKWLQTFSAGVDHPVFTMLTEQGVRVTTASGASAVPISHAVAMHLLALGRKLPESLGRQRAREWARVDGRDLAGTTTIVLGFGPIGRAVAELLPAFGSRVIVLRRAVVGDEGCETWPMSRLGEALPIADQLVLALPATPDTADLLDEAALAALPDHTLIVNVGRGELIDEDALVAACERGEIGGAALDVFVEEPLPTSSPLWGLPNVIITPHISARTPSTQTAAIEIFFDNLTRFTNGEALVNEI